MKLTHTLFVVSLLSCCSLAAADKPEKREMLSTHETLATFEGLAYQRCRGRTARCPDHCGNSGDMATFKITQYLNYEKPGKYGDAKAETYRFMVQDNQKKPKVAPAMQKTIAVLKPGDRVTLSWRHDYVTRDGSSRPERTVTKLMPFAK